MKYLSSQEKQAITTFKQTLNKNLGNNLKTVYLFGSKARGDYHQNSDIDVLVIVKHGNSKIENIIYGVVTEIGLTTDIYLSVKIYTVDQFKEISEMPTIFYQTIKKDLTYV